MLLLINAATKLTATSAFQILQPVRKTIRTADRKPQLEAFSFQAAGSFFVSDEIDLGGELASTEAAVAATSDAEAFTDQIDYFGDPTIQTLVLVFGGVILLLSGLSVLSQKVDSAIEGVVVDFESVLKTNPEFRAQWQDIEVRLESYDGNDEETLLRRKQKLFEIMEEMYETEPALMKKINSKMEALRK